jgi:hypothetical protein
MQEFKFEKLFLNTLHKFKQWMQKKSNYRFLYLAKNILLLGGNTNVTWKFEGRQIINYQLYIYSTWFFKETFVTIPSLFDPIISVDFVVGFYLISKTQFHVILLLIMKNFTQKNPKHIVKICCLLYPNLFLIKIRSLIAPSFQDLLSSNLIGRI